MSAPSNNLDTIQEKPFVLISNESKEEQDAIIEDKYERDLSSRDKIAIKFIGVCLEKIFWSDIKRVSESVFFASCVYLFYIIVVKWGCYTQTLSKRIEGVTIIESSSVAIDSAVDVILVLLFVLMTILAIRIFCIGNSVGKIIECANNNRCITISLGVAMLTLFVLYLFFTGFQEYTNSFFHPVLNFLSITAPESCKL